VLRPTEIDCGVATVVSRGMVVVGSFPVCEATARTGKVRLVVVPSTVSLAVTVTLVCEPAVALVASMWTTPPGLVPETVTELMIGLLTGVSPLRATRVRSSRMSCPAMSWPKIV